jgi:hypothetical protein
MPGPADLTSQEHYFPYYHFIPLTQTIDIYDQMISGMQQDFAAAMQSLRTQVAIERAKAMRPQPGALTMNAVLANLGPAPATVLDLALKLGAVRVLTSEVRDFMAKPSPSPMNPNPTLAELKNSYARRMATLTGEIDRQYSGPMPAGGTAATQSGVKPPPTNAGAAAKLSSLKNRF